MVVKPKKFIEFHAPYVIMLAVYLAFFTFAFIYDTPHGIWNGMIRILTSRSLLITDYIAVGGLSATLVNAALVGTVSVVLLMLSGIKPSGATIMAMWMTTGFAFFGKNIYNMIPLTCGVWLFSKYNKEPFTNYSLAALLVATLSPSVSEISFMGLINRPVEILLGIGFGVLIGFIFPAISSSSARAHLGYNLYNMGFAGGLICVVLVPVLKSLGLLYETPEVVSGGNNFILATGLYIISAALFCCGLFLGNPKGAFENCRNMLKSSGRLVSDFFYEHGYGVYINMAVLCAFATTVVLALGAEINGPAVAGIFTVMAFGSFGKHIRNVPPIMVGAVACVYINGWDVTNPGFILAILFSTGLAPIAGQFGWVWGILAGFLHVYIVMHTGYLGGGMNLYSNGFAAGFVAMFLLPMITVFGKENRNED